MNKENKFNLTTLINFIKNPKLKSELNYNIEGISNSNKHTQINEKEISEIIATIVKVTEIKKLERFLEINIPEYKFDMSGYSIKHANGSLMRFYNLPSGIRQKFRIFTSIAMQVASVQKSLILIDEPEISLHLSWQRTFVDDLISFLSEMTSDFRTTVDDGGDLQGIISIIVSTHSPAIIANHYHRAKQIGESDFLDE